MMNQEENDEKDQREGRYRESQDDVKIIRKELNKLTGVFGELKSDLAEIITALKGNDYGQDGIIKRVYKIETKLDETGDRMDDISARQEKLDAKQDKKITILLWIAGITGAFLTIVIKWFLDNIFKK